MPEIRGGFGSFKEAEAYFRQKLNLPTRRWDELWQGQHARAFVAAGVTREAVLTDLREAVDAAISKGETLEDFRRRFAEIVRQHGWIGGAGSESASRVAWRTAVIYHTNLRTAYQAGRWETLKRFPYLKYKHNTVRNPREQHKAWDGLVLASDDPWWNTHYPPNGWGCRCTVFGVSEARLRADGKRPDIAPPEIDGDPPPEWRYHVGHAASGRLPPEAARPAKWEDVTPGDWKSAGRPEELPSRPTVGEPLRGVGSRDALVQALTAKWRAPSRDYTLHGDDGFRYPVVVDAAKLADHLPVDRLPFAGYLDDLLGDPDEIYMAFVRDEVSGRYALRLRVIRALEIEGRTMFVALDASKGKFEGVTLYRRRSKDARSLRRGKLIYARK